MKAMKIMSGMKGISRWLKGLALLSGLLSGPALAGDQVSAPPMLPLVRKQLQNLQGQGRLLSLEYDSHRHRYRISLLQAQGQLLRYELDPVTGRLNLISGRRQPVIRPQGLIGLEDLLLRVFGQTPIQLLEAELSFRQGQPVYELEWLQQGSVQKACFDARSGQRLSDQP